MTDALDQMPEWLQKEVLGRLRKSYIYTRSAAQRALERTTDGVYTNMDAVVETIWWVSACDSYLWTIVPRQWKLYKGDKPWSDLISGINWARNQTLHDPLAMGAVVERWEVVDGVYKRLEQWRWADHSDIPVADPGRENQTFAECYRTAVQGRAMVDTLAEAVEAIRRVSIDAVASL